jgi:hypothetical protein
MRLAYQLFRISCEGDSLDTNDNRELVVHVFAEELPLPSVALDTEDTRSVIAQTSVY